MLGPGRRAAALVLATAALAGCARPQPRAAGEVGERAAAGALPPETKAILAQERMRRGEMQGATPEDPFGPDVKHLDLHAVMRYALEHSPRIRAARYRHLASAARKRASGWIPDPQFTWSHAFEEVQTRNGPIRDVFSLTQTFPYYGKLRLERRAASARADAEREAMLSTELEVLRDIQQAYFDIYLTMRQIEINERTRGILDRFVRVAQRKFAAGKGAQPDILLGEIELGRIEVERIDLDQRLETEKALLNTLLGRKASAHIPPPSVSESDPRYRGNLDALIAWMMENLPDLRGHRELVEENRARLRLARLRYVPELTLGVTLTNVAEPPVRMGAVHDGRDGIAGMVGINIPVWLPKYSAETRAARQALEAARAAQTDIELLSVYRVIEKHVRVETALRQVELLGTEILPKARQSLEVLEAAYEAGSVDFLKLLDAERALERFDLESERARAEFEKRFADLERAVGKPLRKEAR